MKHKKTAQAYPLANIKVVGIGGGGGNMISRMSRDVWKGVDFMAINTDHQDLDQCTARHKIYIGRNLTRGLGTGMNPELGRQAAEENRSDIAEAMKGADLIFIAAGLGGGTGTGAGPIVAEAAKQTGALTLAFVTRPFAFEGSQRDRVAQEGIAKLRDKVDALIVVPNDRIFSIISRDTPLMKAFEAIDDVLKSALRGMVELIIAPGIINVDFADIKTVMQDAGSAIVGMGIASGQDRAANAVEQALNSPLLEVNPEGAKGVVLGISGRDLMMNEIHEAAKLVAQTADSSARIIFGAYYDRRLKAKELKVTLIATGFTNAAAQPSTLFSSRFKDEVRPNIFDEEGARAGAPLPPLAPTKAASAASAITLEEFSPKAAASQKDEKGKKKESGDTWDIPAFLRRRKR